MLEQVQQRAVNMVVGLKSNSYEGKYKELNITSLHERRMRGDMIQVWKYLHGQNCGGNELFKMASEQHDRTSRHTSKPLNICRENSRLEVRKNFFTPRSVDRWNRLPDYVQGAEDLNSFKNEHDKFSQQTKY